MTTSTKPPRAMQALREGGYITYFFLAIAAGAFYVAWLTWAMLDMRVYSVAAIFAGITLAIVALAQRKF